MTASRQILFASLGAAALALIILVTLVLPAEYGWDPLGSGEALGLTGMSEADQSSLRSQAEPWRRDNISFQLAPFEAVEYKYRLETNAVMVYRWQADGELVFDMHSEPDGAAPGYAESFAKSRADQSEGSYQAPFSGIHGWFWQNRGETDVTVTLETAGFYTWALEMRDGQTFRYELAL